MDNFWDKAFPTAVGALIGGFTTIAAIAIKEWLDRRRSVQSWFEEVFISEGISQLIVYLSAVEDLLDTIDSKDVVPSELFEPYPRVAIERFRKLFPTCGRAIVWVQILRSEWAKTGSGHNASEHGIQFARGLCADLQQTFLALERELLGFRITRKKQLYEIQENESMRQLLDGLERKLEERRKELKRDSIDNVYPDSTRRTGHA